MCKISTKVLKFLPEVMKNCKVELTAGENAESNLPGEIIFTITICNSNDATQLHS